MLVTNKQAFTIAKFLHKGISTGDNDISLSVWGKGAATIGIKKKRAKYMIYVSLDDKRDKSIRFPLFTKDVDLQDLADLIQQALQDSPFLEDKELDTSRKMFMDDAYDDGEDEQSEEEPEMDEEKTTEPAFDEVNVNSEEDFMDFENSEEDETHEVEKDEDQINTETETVHTHTSSSYKNPGFDIAAYLTDTALSGSVMSKSRNIAEKIASWNNDTEKELEGEEKDYFVNFLDSVIQALAFSKLTQEEAVPRGDTLYMRDVFDFVMNRDLNEIEAYFKKLTTSHLAFTPYRIFSYAEAHMKASVMQSLILRLSNYATIEFNELFDDIYKEMAEAEEIEARAMEESETMDDTLNTGFDTNLEVDGEANAYYALTEPDMGTGTELGEVRSASQLQKQIKERASDFASGMNNVFLSIVTNEPDAAEKLYLVAIQIALQGKSGDASALASEIKTDVRDVIMADYEYKLRKKEIQNAL